MVAGLSEQQSCLLFKAKIVAIHTCLLYIHLIQSLYMKIFAFFSYIAQWHAGLENFRWGFSFKKMPAKFEMKTKKKSSSPA